MTCRHCRWSESRPSGLLWCSLLRLPAQEPCRGYEREPGADDDL